MGRLGVVTPLAANLSMLNYERGLMLFLKLLPPPLGSSFCHLALACNFFQRHPLALVEPLGDFLGQDDVVVSGVCSQRSPHIEDLGGGELVNVPVGDGSILEITKTVAGFCRGLTRPIA